MNEIIVFVGGFLAAFIGSMSGGGAGFISFAALLYAGLPVKAAIATNAFGDFGFFPTAVRNFNKAGQIKKKALPAILTISIVGTFIGTLLIIHINEAIFNRVIGAILILVVIVILRDRKLPTKERKPKKSWMPVYFASQVVGGVSSAGTGILASLSLLHLRGFTPIQALANSFAANFVGARQLGSVQAKTGDRLVLATDGVFRDSDRRSGSFSERRIGEFANPNLSPLDALTNLVMVAAYWPDDRSAVAVDV